MNSPRVSFRLSNLAIVAVVAPVSTYAFTPDSLLIGYGTTIKGFGDTTEEVELLDIGLRWTRPLSWFEKEGSIDHELWVEPVFHAMIHDSDSSDDNDYGLATVSFLGAWIFRANDHPELFFFLGGGPAYLFSDIDGMGSDLNGNYQVGFGIRKLKFGNLKTEIQLKYHHVSNLNRAKPNVPLNSIRMTWGFDF